MDVAVKKGKLPRWLIPASKKLMQTAEDIFGEGNGDKKRQWVIDSLTKAAAHHDIKIIPDPIENAIEPKAIEWVIETLWEQGEHLAHKAK